MSQVDREGLLAQAENAGYDPEFDPSYEKGRDQGVRYRVLGAICSLAVIAYLHRVGFATAAPELKAYLGLTDRQLSYLMGAFMLSYGVVEIPFGMLSDRFGVRTLLCMLVLAWSALTAAIAGVLWLPGGAALALGYLLVLRVLFGVTQGGMFPSVSRMLADWMPVDERGLAQGCVWTSSRIGGAIAPLVVVALFALLGVGIVSFATMASLGLLWCLLFWPWFRNTPEEMPGVSQAELKRIQTGRPAVAKGHGHGHASAALCRTMLTLAERLVPLPHVWARSA
ncbi:MAG: MFS transporter [Isosphaeraceae bacterium]